MSRWFRWYEGTAEDGKFRLVARKSRVTVRDVLALWAVMLEDAADLAHQGVCTMRFDLIESVLDLDEGMARTMVDQMATIEMVSGEEGSLTVCNWSKRQFKSDVDETAAMRQAKKRERDKSNGSASVTRDIGPSHTALETDSDSDTDSDAIASDSARGRHDRPKPIDIANWEPDQQDRAYALDQQRDPERILADIRSWASNVAPAKRRKLDPRQFWQGWCRRAADRGECGLGGQRQNGKGAASLAASARALLAEGEIEPGLRPLGLRPGEAA